MRRACSSWAACRCASAASSRARSSARRRACRISVQWTEREWRVTIDGRARAHLPSSLIRYSSVLTLSSPSVLHLLFRARAGDDSGTTRALTVRSDSTQNPHVNASEEAITHKRAHYPSPMLFVTDKHGEPHATQWRACTRPFRWFVLPPSPLPPICQLSPHHLLRPFPGFAFAPPARLHPPATMLTSFAASCC